MTSVSYNENEAGDCTFVWATLATSNTPIYVGCIKQDKVDRRQLVFFPSDKCILLNTGMMLAIANKMKRMTTKMLGGSSK